MAQLQRALEEAEKKAAVVHKSTADVQELAEAQQEMEQLSRAQLQHSQFQGG